MNLWHNARLLNLLANGLFAATLVALIVGALSWFAQRPAFAVRSVEIGAVSGRELQHLPGAATVDVVRRAARGNFFTLSLESVRAAVETVPWVRSARVRKVWPKRLEIAIDEHRALALWETGRLVNSYGELFDGDLERAEADGMLPQLGGPLGSEAEVLKRYAEFSEVLVAIGRQPVSVTLSPRRAWRAQLDDGTVMLLGRESGKPHVERVRQWVLAYPHVLARLNRRAGVVDMRYPNGFALRSLARLDDERAGVSTENGPSNRSSR